MKNLPKQLAQYNDYICAEILADKLEIVPLMRVVVPRLR